MPRSVRAALALLAALVAATPAARAQPPADSGRFEQEIREMETGARRASPPTAPVLFVGSSSIRMWCGLDRDFPGLPVLNRGFGGSEMRDVLHYADRIVFAYRPRTIVLYAGDNDLAAGTPPARVAEEVRRFAALVHARLPGTRLVYLAVKPSPARLALLPQQRETNALLRAEADRDTLATFVDVFTPMLGRDGRPRAELFGADGLHMSSAGYAVWTAALAPALAGERVRKEAR